MLVGLSLLILAFASGLGLVAKLGDLREHRIDPSGRSNPWGGASPSWATNVLSSANYDVEGRRRLVPLKIALLVIWLVFMGGGVLVVSSLAP